MRSALARSAPAEVGAEQRGAIDPDASLYAGAYDGRRLPDPELRAVFSEGRAALEARVDRLELRPDDIARARELGLVDDLGAQGLAQRSLDALERAGVEELPREIRYTHAGPFYLRVQKDDVETLRELKTAMGLDPDRRAPQSSGARDGTWDFATLERLRDEGRLRVVDRFGQDIDILGSTDIDGRRERLVDPKVHYRSIDYEPHPEHGDDRRQNALDGDFVMIEAWNQELSEPEPGIVYEVPAYEMPRFNDGEKVDVHADDTQLWRYETLEDPGRDGRGRVGRVTGEVNLVRRAPEQIAARLEAELGRAPDPRELQAAVEAHRGARGWAENRGMEYVRYPRDQSPAGNAAMIEAGMRDPAPGVPYHRSPNRYNGGHVIAASLGGPGEGINVTAQAEGNNQDRAHWATVNDPEGGRRTLRMNESWHDWERHLKNLSALEERGLTVAELRAQGLRVPAAVAARYGEGERIPFEVETSIRAFYEDEATSDEPADRRHGRELGRFTSTRLVHRETGELVAELTMASYNFGRSDEDYDRKLQMLFDAGFLDRDGGYADDARMDAFAGTGEPPPDVSGAGTLDEDLPRLDALQAFARTDAFRRVWGPNVRPGPRNGAAAPARAKARKP